MSGFAFDTTWPLPDCSQLHCWSGLPVQLETPTAEPEELNGEVWRSVEGTKASVSSLGRFRSAFGVVSTPSPMASGYVRVQIDGKVTLPVKASQDRPLLSGTKRDADAS